MATYKLTYFDTTAKGEPIRFLFSYGNIPFEDNRIQYQDWPKLKPNVPFGQIPILEFNGKVINQSVAIAKYVAKLVKLVGKDDWENLEIDSAVDSVNDLRQKIAFCHYEKDEKVKEARREVLFKETLPFMLERLDKQVAKNNGYLAVGRLTWADLFFVSLLHYMNAMAKIDIIAEYPNLVKVQKTVLAIPSIKAWVAKRPKTEY